MPARNTAFFFVVVVVVDDVAFLPLPLPLPAVFARLKDLSQGLKAGT